MALYSVVTTNGINVDRRRSSFLSLQFIKDFPYRRSIHMDGLLRLYVDSALDCVIVSLSVCP